MTSTHISRAERGEAGFTLIELLVTVALVGILTAIALPAFLLQQQKGQDSRAKSDARNLVSHLHTCFQEQNGFVGCTVDLAGVTGLPVGAGPGTVRIASELPTGYTVSATSTAKSDVGGVNTNHEYVIEFDQQAGFSRLCSPADKGGCPEDTDGDGLGEW